MIVTLSLANYRNIKNLNINFSEHETLILGKNGQGKTSILEAIYFLCIGKAYRTNDWIESINFKEDYTQIKAAIKNLELKNSDACSSFNISFAKQPTKQIKYKINEIPKKAFDFIGNFQCVLFSPEDLRIITGAPQERRDFIDSLLIRLDKNYAHTLNSYNKVIKHRNKLLKDISQNKCEEAFLDIWDEKLCEYGVIIIEKRLFLIEKLNVKIKKFYKDISKKSETMSVNYHSDIKNLKDNFIESLKSHRKRDIILGSTSIGPHRDDLQFFLEGKEMRDFSSQGEIRTGILTLKYAEIELLKEKTSEVTLLLDDVFSELDEERQGSLIELAKNYQTIITSTSLPKGYEGSLIYKMSDGEIS